MTLRNIALLGSLAMVLGGCVAVPPPHNGNYVDRDYSAGEDYYDYRTTPSYEGYYYVRIIFLGNIPYYVDDDRYIRPIPPRLYDHFRRYPYYTNNGRAPVFSRDTEVRDGYHMSRIVYLDDTPYYVEDNRGARPLPPQLHEHFRYSPFRQNVPPYNGGRPMTPPQGRPFDTQHSQPPGYYGQPNRNVPPAYGREGPAPYVPDHEQDDDSRRYTPPQDQRRLPVFPPSNRGGMMPPPGADIRDDAQPMPPSQDNRGMSAPNPQSFGIPRAAPPQDNRGMPGPAPQNSGMPRGNPPFGSGSYPGAPHPQPNNGGRGPAPGDDKSRGQGNDEQDNDHGRWNGHN